MATVCAKVFKHHQKTDGTYNVKIRVFHKNEKKWIDTTRYVTDKQLSKKMDIKDPFINNLITKTLDEYRKLDMRLDFFTCENLRDYLETHNQEIDLIKFCDEYIQQLKVDKREGTAANHSTVRNSLIDFFGRERISILEINGVMIKTFDRFLRGQRNITRLNHRKLVTKVSGGLKDKGVNNMMRDLRTLFNEAKKRFNMKIWV